MSLPGLPRAAVTKIDCGNCRKCCKGHQLIALVEEDNRAEYQCHEFAPGQWAVDRTEDGDCVYLGPQGCTIWGKHPAVCRAFDCVAFVRRMDQGAFVDMGPRLDNAVIREGRKRLARENRR
jgi:Fe-S-cluster containining protein